MKNDQCSPHLQAHRGQKALNPSQQYFDLHAKVLEQLPYSAIEAVAGELVRAYARGKAVYLFGNGGSAALASHFACDLGKGTIRERDRGKRFRVMALTDNNALITAWANDSSYEDIFAEQIKNFLDAGDVAFAISGSGNSPNVLRALEASRELGAITVGLTGYSGGKMKPLCDYCMVVPSDNMQIIEDFHLSISHSLYAQVCQAMVRSYTLAAVAGSISHSD